MFGNAESLNAMLIFTIINNEGIPFTLYYDKVKTILVLDEQCISEKALSEILGLVVSPNDHIRKIPPKVQITLI